MYPRIIERIRTTPWVATPETVHAIVDAINNHRRIAGAAEPGNVRAHADDDDESERNNRNRKPWRMVGTSALIPVSGILGKRLSSLEMMCGGCSVDALEAALVGAAEDPEAENILLHFDTPGGAVTGVPELGRLIASINSSAKPVIGWTDTLCCSGGQWLAANCQAVYASPTASVGSIGVYSAWIDASDKMAKEGLKLVLFQAGKFKAAGLPGRPMSKDEAAMFQTEVERIWADFKATVREGRSLAGATVPDSAMEGQTFRGAAAVSAGLVDGLYDRLGDAIAAELG